AGTSSSAAGRRSISAGTSGTGTASSAAGRRSISAGTSGSNLRLRCWTELRIRWNFQLRR
ncbi:uncharacterized protein LOC119090193, partial [Pollicipes pollicipes]|uniref:uncharacterized protein LOC119090193 n=1 Tax=Pollicipes pollicipes TaxID=41117 RepID=UPI001884DE1D